jgi:hypothetical protein
MTPAERDLAVRTILSEAGNQGPDGMAAVAHVIRNRAISGRYGGNSIASVITHPYAFEGMDDRGGHFSDTAYTADPASSSYQAAAKIVDGVESGAIPDPTNGATHYLNAKLQADEGRNQPSWASGKPLATIGAHTFYAPDGPIDGKGGPGPAIQVADASSPTPIPDQPSAPPQQMAAATLPPPPQAQPIKIPDVTGQSGASALASGLAAGLGYGRGLLGNLWGAKEPEPVAYSGIRGDAAPAAPAPQVAALAPAIAQGPQAGIQSAPLPPPAPASGGASNLQAALQGLFGGAALG